MMERDRPWTDRPLDGDVSSNEGTRVLLFPTHEQKWRERQSTRVSLMVEDTRVVRSRIPTTSDSTDLFDSSATNARAGDECFRVCVDASLAIKVVITKRTLTCRRFVRAMGHSGNVPNRPIFFGVETDSILRDRKSLFRHD